MKTMQNISSTYVGCGNSYEMRRKFKILLRDSIGNLMAYSEMNKKDRNYIRNLIDPTVTDDSSIEDEIRVKSIMQHRMVTKQPHVMGHLGWILDKEIPHKVDIVYSHLTFGPNVYIVRSHVKEVIEQAELKGGYFQPVWLKEVKNIDKPDYYTFSTTNILPFKFNKSEEKNAFLIPHEFQEQLLDFNGCKYGGAGELSIISPFYISQKAYKVIKDFKPLEFVPVIFE